VHDRHDLTDEEWALLEPLLPTQTPRRSRPWKDHRTVVNGVLWRTRTGSPWRDLPESYGCWKTVYNRHRRWSADGTWAEVLSELQRGCDVAEDQWVVAIDSTVVRAHHHAAGARHEPPGDVPAQVVAVALAAELAKTMDGDQDTLAVPGPVTGGWIESHESSTVTGQTR
jgi:transposase